MSQHPYVQFISSRQTPFYLYDLGLLDQTLLELNRSNLNYGFHVHYAIKANAQKPILSRIQSHGFGADCVSGNEIDLAIKLGFPASQIVFAGVGKTDSEITRALHHDIGCFNCESLEEIQVIDQLAGSMGKTARIALRINPNLDAQTHKHITTGTSENKFGLSRDELVELLDQRGQINHVEVSGVHFHIGSQITDFSVFERLGSRANEVVKSLEDNDLRIKHVNLGGGLGIDYSNPIANPIPAFSSYFSALARHLDHRGRSVHLELGRSLVGQCGNLISRVVFVKRGEQRKFLILDAGMTELIRPALYQSEHKIENLSSRLEPTSYDVVGPVCESSDSFGKNVSLPISARGDYILIRSAGAYGEVMKSNYNLRELNNPVFVQGKVSDLLDSSGRSGQSGFVKNAN